jgi:hypothetical protein
MRKTAKIYKLNFNGKMKKVTIELPKDFPKETLKVDDWFAPQVGELCLNSKNELDAVKKINFQSGNSDFKATNIYSLESGEKCSESLISRVEVKRGKVFLFKEKIFVHQEPLDGGYIDKIARGESITKYEYEKFK